MLRAYAIGLILGLLVLAASLALFTERVTVQARVALDERAARLVERLDERMTLELREVVGDLRFLAGRAERELARSPGEPAPIALVEDYLAFSARKPRYDQIRYLDAAGLERVRVNLTGDGPYAVPSEGLQSKLNRYYFTETMALAPGQVYVSRFDLNIEHGRVEVPLKPMIRVATPLADGRGAVVLNYLGGRLLDDLRRASFGFPGRVMLVDDEGHYLLGGPREMDWAFMFDEAAEGGFKRDHREAWEGLAGDFAGGLESDAGLYRMALFPFYSERTGLREGVPHLQRSWRLVAWVPRGLLEARGRQWLTSRLPGAVGLYLAFAAAFWLYLRLRRHQREGEAQIERLHRDIARERDLFVAGPTVMLKWRNEYGWPVEYISGNAAEVLGYPPEHFSGSELTLAGMVVPEFLAQLAEEMERAKEGGREWFDHAPFPVVDAEGGRTWLQLTSMAVRAESGTVTHHFGYFNDITERSRAEQELHRVSRQNALILDAIGEGVYGLDREGYATFFNAAAERMTGWSAAEVIGRHNHRLLHHSHEDGSPYPEERCPVHATVRDGRPRRIRGEVFWRADGTPFPVEYMVAPIRGERENEAPTGAVVVFRDIGDRLAAERALMEAKRSAESANRAKSEFLAAMSHDIRTPMNTILGMGELLADASLDEEQRRWLAISTRAGESLLSLINDILDLSKIESGQLTPERAPFEPRELVEGAAQILTVAAERKGIELGTVIDPKLPARVVGDAARIRQILLNLLGNAVKFTERGGVRLQVERAGGERLRFIVRDSGVGIAAERLEAVFDPFVQAEASTTRRFGGTGLGLAICRKLVERMGGTIEVDSRLGEGSTFRFELPLPEDAGDEAPRRVTRGERVAPAGEERPMELLVVDDSEDNRLLVSAFLKASPHRLHFAENGREALNRFREGRFDLVLMDLQMPEMDGFEATRRIRGWEEQEGREPTPIIALTAHAMEEQREESERAGCDYHLTKPLKKRRLLEVIAAYGRRPADD